MRNTCLLLFSLSLAAGLFSCTPDPDVPEPPVPEPKLLKEYSVYNTRTGKYSLCYSLVYDNQERVTRLTRFSVDSNVTPVLRDTVVDFHFSYDGSASLPSGYVALRQGYTFTHLLYYDAQNRPFLDSCKGVTPAYPANSYVNFGSSVAFSYDGNKLVKVIRNFPGRADKTWGLDTFTVSNGNTTERTTIVYQTTTSTHQSSFVYGNVANPFHRVNVAGIVIVDGEMVSKDVYTQATDRSSSSGSSSPATIVATYQPFLNANGQIGYSHVLIEGLPAPATIIRYKYYE